MVYHNIVATDYRFLLSSLSTLRHYTSLLWDNMVYILPLIQNGLGVRHILGIGGLHIDDITTQTGSSP